MEIKAPRGTSDILPEKAGIWQFLERRAISLFERYGYRRIITPIFEYTELFRQGIGESTDIVQKEMYTFRDRRGRSLTLRPEATAPVVRAFLEHDLLKHSQPVKLYYIGPMFRYERPQAGRYREFWQIGVEAIGSLDPALDGEVILLLMHYLKDVGLKHLQLHLNSMGCFKCRPSFTESLEGYLQPRIGEFCSDCKRRIKLNPLRVFDCKKEACQNLLSNAPRILDHLCEDCKVHFHEVQEYLKMMDLNHVINPSLVRGLDYYTRTTFEVISPHLGAQNALGGGGRYDNLVEGCGGPPTPATGFALGTERVAMALEKEGVSLPKDSTLDVFLAIVGRDQKPDGFALLSRIREEDIAADMDYGGRSLKGQMKLADKLGVSYALFLGSKELGRGVCRIRDMKTGEQVEVKLEEVPKWLKIHLK